LSLSNEGEIVLKLKVILVTVLAFGGMAHAQGFLSNLSIGGGFQGVFPGTTFTKSTAETTGDAKTQATTNSVGAVADARYDFGRHSAFDLSITVNRNSELFLHTSFTLAGFTQRVQTNNVEAIGTYIFRLPSNNKVKPYALIGGGMVHFSPNGTNFTTGAVPQTDTKPAFAYGFGSDFRMSDRWDLRLQYRGLIRSEPDFKLLSAGPFGSGLKTHVAEPSIQVVYHF
jgi:opacity protein-like surface antigen